MTKPKVAEIEKKAEEKVEEKVEEKAKEKGKKVDHESMLQSIRVSSVPVYYAALSAKFS